MGLKAIRGCICDFYDASKLFLQFGPVPLKEFKDSCRKVSYSRSMGALSDMDFYTFYGLYKQAKFGDCTIEAEDFQTEEQAIKSIVWKKNKGMSRKDAMVEYIRLASQILGDFKSELETTSSIYGTVLLMDSKDVFEHDDFFSLVAEGELEGVKKRLSEMPKLATIKSPEGLTALHLAADRGYLELVKFLIEKGADVNAVDDNGDAPIHVALESHEDEVVKALVAAGADLNLKNWKGMAANDLLNLSYMEAHVVEAP